MKENLEFINCNDLLNNRTEELENLERELEIYKKKQNHTFQKLPFYLRRRQMSRNPRRIPKALQPKNNETENCKLSRKTQRNPSRFSIYKNRMERNRVRLSLST